MATKKTGGGIQVGGLRIGCGWIVIAVLVGLWLLNRRHPEWVAPVAGGVSHAVQFARERIAARRAAPQPSPGPTAPPATSPQPSPQPTVAASPAPSPSPEEDAGEERPASATTLETHDVTVGAGKEAKIGCTVKIRFAAAGGLPVDFVFMVGAGEVAPGLEKGVAGMKVGGKRQLTVPAELAKGPLPGGAGGSDGLRGEVALLDVL